MRFNLILNTAGITLKYISLIFLIPVVFALFYKESAFIPPFITSSAMSYLFGMLLSQKAAGNIDDMTRTESFAVVLSTWGVYGLVCMIPFLFFGLSPINSLFEAFSGISTTGATILSDYAIYPKTFFIYRALIQWFGGMGIMVFFIAILPKFAIAGRQMFFAETPNPTQEKITPRIRGTASWLWSIYILLTILQVTILKSMGLSFYDSICSSLSTISAGGFSNNPSSLIGYSPKVVWTVGFFAFLAGINFLLTYKVLIKGKFSEIFKNEEFKTYFGIVAAFLLLIASILHFQFNMPLADAIRNGFFETAATITSTGAVSDDYSFWPLRAKVLLFVLMFIGGSAISASGSIKIARWVFVFKFVKKELNKIVHPNLISPIKLDNRTVASETGHQIIMFIMFFVAAFAISAILVAFIEQNTAIALTGSIATLSNTGPGFDAVIGPMGNYDGLNPATKLIFVFNMFVGRLELIPFLALLNKDLWQIRK